MRKQFNRVIANLVWYMCVRKIAPQSYFPLVCLDLILQRRAKERICQGMLRNMLKQYCRCLLRTGWLVIIDKHAQVVVEACWETYQSSIIESCWAHTGQDIVVKACQKHAELFCCQGISVKALSSMCIKKEAKVLLLTTVEIQAEASLLTCGDNQILLTS